MRTSIRGGMGLGDALYVQAITRHLVLRGESMRVHTAWPDVFKQLGESVRTASFRRDNIDLLAHYSKRKGRIETTQFKDCCIQAGIREDVELRLDWVPEDLGLLDRLKRIGRPIICISLARSPMGRTDGFGAEVLPDCAAIQTAIDRVKDRALIVQLGSGKSLFRFEGIDVDLSNETTVTQLLDVASIASGFIGYPSFIVPLAESFSKPVLTVFSRRGLESTQIYVRQITPRKVLHRVTSTHVIDDCDRLEIEDAADDLLR